MAVCAGGVCREGFEVKHELAPLECRYLPVVRELTAADLGYFAESLERSPQRNRSGTFKSHLKSACTSDGWNGEWCVKPASIVRISQSADPQELGAYRHRWLELETKAHREYLFAQATRFSLPPLITVLAIGWPWALCFLIPRFRRYIGWSLLLAIPIQLSLCYLFYLGSSLALDYLTHWLLRGYAIALLVGIPLQIGYLIKRRGAFRAKAA